MSTLTPNYGLIKPGVNDPTDQDLWGGMLNEDMDIIDAQMKANADAAAVGSVPIGAPMDYFGSTAPADYRLCNGETIGNTGSGADYEGADYEALFNIVKECAPNTGSEVFASGDTVVIPDLRGEFIRVWDNGRGIDPARALGSAQLDSVQNATGQLTGVLVNNSGSELNGVLAYDAGAGANLTAGGAARQQKTVSIDLSRQIRTSTETRGRNIALNKIVRYK